MALTPEELRDRVGLAILGGVVFWLVGLPIMAWQHADLEPYLRLGIAVPLLAFALVMVWVVVRHGDQGP